MLGTAPAPPSRSSVAVGRRGAPRWLVVTLVLCLAATAGAAEPTPLDDLVRALPLTPLGGEPPAFALELLDGGKRVSLGDFKGRPVLIYFWATW
jgi:hypothetical protein